MVSVGEISGDRNVSHVVSRLKKMDPSLDFCGLVGSSLKKEGVREWANITGLSSIGFLEPFRHALRYFSLYHLIKKRLQEEKPDLVLCVDSQGLNMVILKMARELGIPTLYYISPMEWHWGSEKGGRKVLKKVDRILSIIQKEDRFYKKLGGDVVYVGHPLVDTTYPKLTKEDFYEKYGLQEHDRILALFPGSRKQELRLIYPVLLEATRFILTKQPHLKIFISVVEGSYHNLIREGLEKFRLQQRVTLYQGASPDLISHSDLSLVTSGTISLEHAILEKPCVVVYKLSKLSYWVVKNFFSEIFEKVPYVSLVNEFFQKEILPEYLQDQARPDLIANHALRFLEDSSYYEEVSHELAGVHRYLGKPGTLDRTATEILTFIKNQVKANSESRAH